MIEEKPVFIISQILKIIRARMELSGSLKKPFWEKFILWW